jgi:hypothetical protein
MAMNRQTSGYPNEATTSPTFAPDAKEERVVRGYAAGPGPNVGQRGRPRPKGFVVPPRPGIPRARVGCPPLFCA